MRSNQRGASGPTQPGGALVKSARDINLYLEHNVKPELSRIIPPRLDINAEMIIRQCINAIRNDKDQKLIQCTPESIGNAIMYAGAVGLEVGTVRGHAYLIPYGNKCTFQVGYKGLTTLAYRSGKVGTINAECVTDLDEFEFVQGGGEGGSDLFLYRPKRVEPFGEWMTTFVRVIFKDRSIPAYIHEMRKHEVLHVKEKNAQGTSHSDSPWNKYPTEMFKKTVTKRGMKTLDLSPPLSGIVGLDDMTEATGDQRIIDIKDWHVVEPGMLPAAPATTKAADDPEPEAAADDPTAPGVTGPLSIQKNWKPEEQPKLVKNVRDCFKYVPDAAAAFFGKGPGNEAHLDSFLARWQGTKNEFIVDFNGLLAKCVDAYKQRGGK